MMAGRYIINRKYYFEFSYLKDVKQFFKIFFLIYILKKFYYFIFLIIYI